MRLEAHLNALLAARQIFGDGIGLVKEIARLILIQTLGRDYYTVDQNVEGAITRLSTPIVTNIAR
jgi:hypothetical protein